MEHRLDWGFVSSTVKVMDSPNAATSDDIVVTWNLRQVNTTDLAQVEYGQGPKPYDAVSSATPGLFGPESKACDVNQVCYLDLTLKSKSGAPVVLPHTVIDFRFQLDNVQSLWLPSIAAPGKNYRPKGMLEYTASITTHLCNLAPMGAFYSAEGLNKLSFALSDCKNIVKVTAGVYEEQTCGRVSFDLFETPAHAQSEYQVTLRLDSALMPVFNAVENMARFYERFLGIEAMPVPEGAYGPVYSTWYAFLQNLQDQEIEDQCKLGAECGLKTVIVDDGWQTDDNNRGYAFCGDWQVSKTRFPHMREHVERIHAFGMKYMVWFSVPFIGRKAQRVAELKDYCLCFNPRWDAYVLDPRYKKVRDFLVATFSNMVKDYNLDGLKLDFIDEFDLRQADEKAAAYDAARDTQSIPDAVDMLMTEVRDALMAINPEILVEFRQNYIGPMIRKYGNMLRAHDCPSDTLMNRMTTIDLRATSLQTAVHADMFTWSPQESVESSSLQFIHTLFAVPQVSCNFKHINAEHKAMVKHWITFWEEHRDLLMHGQIKATHPEFMYTDISATKDGKQVRVIGSDHIFDLFDESLQEVTLVNGAMVSNIVVKSSTPAKVSATTFNCLGQKQESTTLELDAKVQELAIPKSGYIVFTRC